MPDLLVRDLPAELKKQIEERANIRGHSLSVEARLLIQRGLAAKKTDEAIPADGLGLGSRLAALIPAELWSDDLIQPRDNSDDRPPPDFS